MRPVGRPPGPGKSGRLRGGPVVRTFGEGGGVRRRASLMGEGRRNAACRGRAFSGRRPLGLRASKGAEARPVGAGRGDCGPGPAFLGRGSAPKTTIIPRLVSILCTRRYALAPALRLRV